VITPRLLSSLTSNKASKCIVIVVVMVLNDGGDPAHYHDHWPCLADCAENERERNFVMAIRPFHPWHGIHPSTHFAR